MRNSSGRCRVHCREVELIFNHVWQCHSDASLSLVRCVFPHLHNVGRFCFEAPSQCCFRCLQVWVRARLSTSRKQGKALAFLTLRQSIYSVQARIADVAAAAAAVAAVAASLPSTRHHHHCS
eukprot:1686974-Pleurochrysis_carterae.AAC.1